MKGVVAAVKAWMTLILWLEVLRRIPRVVGRHGCEEVNLTLTGVSAR